jgi:hypothetical protein
MAPRDRPAGRLRAASRLSASVCSRHPWQPLGQPRRGRERAGRVVGPTRVLRPVQIYRTAPPCRRGRGHDPSGDRRNAVVTAGSAVMASSSSWGLQVHGVADGLVHRVHEHPGSRQARTGSASTAPSARRRSSRRQPSDGCHAACSQADHTASWSATAIHSTRPRRPSGRLTRTLSRISRPAGRSSSTTRPSTCTTRSTRCT